MKGKVREVSPERRRNTKPVKNKALYGRRNRNIRADFSRLCLVIFFLSLSSGASKRRRAMQVVEILRMVRMRKTIPAGGP
jgi:hypothetical protein